VSTIVATPDVDVVARLLLPGVIVKLPVPPGASVVDAGVFVIVRIGGTV
jgi:hypothetical protein